MNMRGNQVSSEIRLHQSKFLLVYKFKNRGIYKDIGVRTFHKSLYIPYSLYQDLKPSLNEPKIVIQP